MVASTTLHPEGLAVGFFLVFFVSAMYTVVIKGSYRKVGK
jgi:hypothetical protein